MFCLFLYGCESTNKTDNKFYFIKKKSKKTTLLQNLIQINLDYMSSFYIGGFRWPLLLECSGTKCPLNSGSYDSIPLYEQIHPPCIRVESLTSSLLLIFEAILLIQPGRKQRSRQFHTNS